MALPDNPTIHISIRNYLNRPNPAIALFPRDPTKTERASHVQSQAPNISDHTLPWTSLTVAYIDKRFGHLLNQEVDLPPFPVLLPAQLSLDSEPSFEAILLAYNNMIVNHALEAACASHSSTADPLVWLRGSYFYLDGQKPDWGGGPTTQEGIPPRYPNYVPGDTKYLSENLPFPFTGSAQMEGSNSSKEEYASSEPLGRRQASGRKQTLSARTTNSKTGRPVSEPVDTVHERGDQISFRAITEQVLNYANLLNTRYCYIVTPIELIAIRCFSDDPNLTGPSPMRTRSQVQYRDIGESPSRRRNDNNNNNDIDNDNDNDDDNDNDIYEALSSQPSSWASGSENLTSSSEFKPSGDYVFAGIQVANFFWEKEVVDLSMDASDKSPGGRPVEDLSYNMALWALHMMAAEDRNFRSLREYEEEDAEFET